MDVNVKKIQKRRPEASGTKERNHRFLIIAEHCTWQLAAQARQQAADKLKPTLLKTHAGLRRS
jgi:hypothetical protein